MKYFEPYEKIIIAFIWAMLGAVLVWGIIMCSGCTYVDVKTDEILIMGVEGNGPQM